MTGTLFDNTLPAGPMTRPAPAQLAAKGDPSTSKRAAAYYLAGDGFETDCGRVYRALVADPGTTSAELAARANLDRHLVAKRLPDLERGGLVKRGPTRECRVGGLQAVTWDVIGGAA